MDAAVYWIWVRMAGLWRAPPQAALDVFAGNQGVAAAASSPKAAAAPPKGLKGGFFKSKPASAPAPKPEGRESVKAELVKMMPANSIKAPPHNPLNYDWTAVPAAAATQLATAMPVRGPWVADIYPRVEEVVSK